VKKKKPLEEINKWQPTSSTHEKSLLYGLHLPPMDLLENVLTPMGVVGIQKHADLHLLEIKFATQEERATFVALNRLKVGNRNIPTAGFPYTPSTKFRFQVIPSLF
jgi:hypothetical protein